MIISTYKKVIKVIDSINHIDHIKPTRNYINNFFKSYSNPSKKMFGPFKTYYIDDFVAEMYNRMLDKLKEKEKSIKKVS